MKYGDGSTQAGVASAPAIDGRASWTWPVADTAAAGAARLTATCGSARATRTMLVVGSLIPPRIQVLKSGFSIRPKSTGTQVSWGLVLKNVSPNADALKIYVLLNFVLADNRALGTKTQTVAAIGAGQTYYLGGNLQFPGQAPIARLEPVIQIGGHQRPAVFGPAIENVAIEPSAHDPGWVGDVAGELVNDDAPWVFQRAKVSAVVLDANGEVLGGGTGFANAVLPPGTRQVFKASQGFSAIPLDRAVQVMVSTEPTYQTGT